MSIASDNYETFIKRLVDNISSGGREIEFLCSGAKCRLTGKTGQPHQIDVAFIDKSYDEHVLVLIECKLRASKYSVGPEIVKIISFNGNDLVGAKGYPDECVLIICSTSNYTRGAKRIAKSINIKLEQVSNSDNYIFRYDNFIQAGTGDALAITDEFTCNNIETNSSEHANSHST